jgi:NitT/TauT family transport system substrate-binding protein
MQRVPNTTLLAGLFVLVIGCRPAPLPLKNVPEVVINIASNPISALATIAEQNNHYQVNGLDVKINVFGTGKQALAAMIAGDGHFAIAAETPLAAAILQGAPLQMLANIGSLDRSTAVVARKDRGIHHPRDLAGRTVGLTQGTSSEYLCYLFLAANGMEMSDINIKTFSPDRLTEELLAGRLDAACLWHPYLDQTIVELKDNGTIFESDVVYMWTMILVGKKEFLEQYPEAARAVIRALLAAQHDFEYETEKSMRIIAERHNVDYQWVESNLPNLRLAVTLNQALVSVLDDNLQWTASFKNKSAKTPPNALDYIYWDALTAEKPEAVTIIKPQ